MSWLKRNFGGAFNPFGQQQAKNPGWQDAPAPIETPSDMPTEGGDSLLSIASNNLDQYDTGYSETTPLRPFKGDVEHAGRQFNPANFDVTNVDQVKNLQQILINEGFDIGGADGMFGPKTENAYRTFMNERRAATGRDEYRHDTGASGDAVRAETTAGNAYDVQNPGAMDRPTDEQGNPIF
jgi:hypothetical protein